MQFTQPLPLSLYVHYPWCVQKCPYCDFNSHQAKADLQQQETAYIDALIRQLETTMPMVWGRPIGSIFFGGGTPSLMSVSGFERLMSQLRALLAFAPDIEVTLEANPGTVDQTKFDGFFQAGANRLSIGVQSFNPQHLKALGRIHDQYQAWSSIEVARAAGFKRLNLDLMFALPNQTLAQALDDIEQALSAKPDHISHYQLTLEPNTPFYRQPPILPDEDLAWDMQSACQTRLIESGYQHYEVSAFAKSDQACRHNLNYWQFGDYIGLGAGAHGKITLAQTGEIWRSQMPASPGAYIEMMAKADLTTRPGRWHKVEASEVVFEFMLNALRLQKGFKLALFEQTTGLPLSHIAQELEQLQAQQWIQLSSEDVKVSAEGQRYLNSLIEVFL